MLYKIRHFLSGNWYRFCQGNQGPTISKARNFSFGGGRNRPKTKSRIYPRKLADYGALIILASLVAGCGTADKSYVITGSSTVFGFQLGRSLESQMYDIKFGYARTEIALVPTNGPPVMMELYYSGNKNFSNNGFYQRLAVGKPSVEAAGAALLFSKDSSGSVNPAVAQKIADKILNIPEIK